MHRTAIYIPCSIMNAQPRSWRKLACRGDSECGLRAGDRRKCKVRSDGQRHVHAAEHLAQFLLRCVISGSSMRREHEGRLALIFTCNKCSECQTHMHAHRRVVSL